MLVPSLEVLRQIYIAHKGRDRVEVYVNDYHTRSEGLAMPACIAACRFMHFASLARRFDTGNPIRKRHQLKVESAPVNVPTLSG